MALYRNITWDGQPAGRTKEGIVGAPIYWRPESNREIVYKYPFDNIQNGAVVIVHQTQRAFLFLNGAMVSSIPPTGAPYRLTTANIPYLQNFLNVPTGGHTPYTAEIWFVNVETERETPWGVGGVPVFDNQFETDFILGAHGMYNFRITDGGQFIKKLVGTLHDFTTDDVLQNFQFKISSIASQTFSDIMEAEKLSIAGLQRKRGSLEKQIENIVNDTLYMYGIRLSNFSIHEFSLPAAYTEILNEKAKGVAERKRLEELGVTYKDARQLKIMEEAAKNPGSGTITAAGIGATLSTGVTSNFGDFMKETAGHAMPSPPPSLPQYHFVLGGAKVGPYTIDQVIAQINAGRITPGTLFWSTGMRDWQETQTSATLRSLFSSL
ncbi:MAG: SPFH domain-containing protein [Tannerellaceae bacterium]|jgi:membrane protease subunit (stomatin/prohibitin family)|nr:SPFH domain-containing protein [Tannerellaceae bacterium]